MVGAVFLINTVASARCSSNRRAPAVFNGFPPRDKPLKRLKSPWPAGTGLKPGGNEKEHNFLIML